MGFVWVRSLRLGLARSLVAAVVGALGFFVRFGFGLSSCRRRCWSSLSSSFCFVLVCLGFFVVGPLALGVGHALAGSLGVAAGLFGFCFGFGLLSSSLFCCLFCPLRGGRRVRCALLPSFFLFLFLFLFFSFLAGLPPPRPRLPPFLFARPRLLLGPE